MPIVRPFQPVYGQPSWHEPDIVYLGDGHWVKVQDDAAEPRPSVAPLDGKHRQSSTTIVVSIAALRETRCPETLLSLIDAAAHPERVRVALVQQNAEDDPDCLAHVCEQKRTPLARSGSVWSNPNGCAFFDRVRVMRLSASEAKGPLYARALANRLVRDEDDFCLQIDAHSLFAPGWDRALLEEWGATANEYAVLSTYPTGNERPGVNVNKHWEMPHLCAARFVKPGVLRNAQAKAAANLQRPLLAPLWAAGLSFSRCHAERRVPNDPNLQHVFDGEEYARGARLWTHGYDFYSITRPILTVWYGDHKGGRGGWRTNATAVARSHARMATLFNAPGSDQSAAARAALGAYGLGTRRSLRAYIAFSGVDPTTTRADNISCTPRYVPWEEQDAVPATTGPPAASAHEPGRDVADGESSRGESSTLVRAERRVVQGGALQMQLAPTYLLAAVALGMGALWLYRRLRIARIAQQKRRQAREVLSWL